MNSPDCGLSILLRLKRQYKFKKCLRFESECLWMSNRWMSNRRRPQLKQEVNINLSSYVTLCISFIEQFPKNWAYSSFHFRRLQQEYSMERLYKVLVVMVQFIPLKSAVKPHPSGATFQLIFFNKYVIMSMGLSIQIMKARFKYRIYPRWGQKYQLSKLFGCVRVVWNDSLAYCQKSMLKKRKKRLILSYKNSLLLKLKRLNTGNGSQRFLVHHCTNH